MSNGVSIASTVHRSRRSECLFVFLALTMNACAVRQGTGGSDDNTDAAEEAAANTVPDPCSAGLTWTDGPQLPVAVDHHATFASDASGEPFLYVIGGFDGNAVHSEVWRASIFDDGTLGTFEPSGELPAGRSGAGLAVAGRDVWLAGGFVADRFSNSVIHGSIDDEGHLGRWSEIGGLPAPRFHATLEVARGYLFVLGGVNERGDAQDTVFRGQIGEQGPAAWDTMTSLPSVRSHHGSYVKDNVLYALGGLRGNPFQNATTATTDGIRAVVQEDGSLEGWEAMPGLSLDVSTHAVTSFSRCAFVLGGASGESFEASAKAFRVTEGGGGFAVDEVDDALPAALSHRHQVPFFRGHFYAVAGSRHHVPTGSVFIGALDRAEK